MFYADNSKIIFRWELAGVFFLIIAGSLLHFVYEWSNYNPVVGVFSPVNESVWEHLKMGFTSLIIFSIIEYWFLGGKVHNFISAKALGILGLELTIVVGFYVYTSIIGTHILFVDILLYVIGCALCQVISCNVLTRTEFTPFAKYVNAGILLALGVSFIVFTFYTPKLPVFKDSRFNSYGTEWKTVE